MVDKNEIQVFARKAIKILATEEGFTFPANIQIHFDETRSRWGTWENWKPDNIRLNNLVTRDKLLSGLFHELVHMGRHYTYDAFRAGYFNEEREEHIAETLSARHLPYLSRLFSFSVYIK